MKAHKLYTGKAGEFYALSFILINEFNVAVPEVDIGDDGFLIKDKGGGIFRIQVKTARVKRRKKTGYYSGQFSLRKDQLETLFDPDLIYFFCFWDQDTWRPPVIIPRRELSALHLKSPLAGKKGRAKEKLSFWISGNSQGEAKLGSHDLSAYSNTLPAEVLDLKK